MSNEKQVLDACCGSKMFWFEKGYRRALYVDNREMETETHGRKVVVAPDEVVDFRSMPYADESFYLVVFDPPHLLRAGESSWLCVKYGKLDKGSWQKDIKQGFSECWRVLKPGGTLVFKWSEVDIALRDLNPLFPEVPLFGSRAGKAGKTHWIVFYKEI